MTSSNAATITGFHAADPERLALAIPATGESVTYGELRARAEAFNGGLAAAGFGRDSRILLAGPIGVDFYALALALAGGARTLVLVDGTMDRRRLLGALRAARADAIVGPGDLLRKWWLIPPLWRAARYSVGARARGTRSHLTLAGAPRPLTDSPDDTVANISFTSGSSGRAKGVVRTHAVAGAQVAALDAALPLGPTDVEMTAFPAVVFRNMFSGATSVLPPMDLRAPATVDPVPVLAALRAHDVTALSGAPVFIERLATHAATGTRLPRLRRVVIGGAPVSRRLCALVQQGFPGAEGIVVYGSTEAEPVSVIGIDEVLSTAGDGYLVGRPIASADVELLTLPDVVAHPLTPDQLRAARTSDGEVVVRGPHVARRYVNDPEAFDRNKIQSTDGSVWHRMGDLARRDAAGRLWLLGPRGTTVGGRYPFVVETRAQDIDGVRNAGFVAHPGAPSGELAVVVSDPAAAASVRAAFPELRVCTIDTMPVDRRHHSKIDRARLAELLSPT